MPRKMFNYASSIDLFNKAINDLNLKSKNCRVLYCNLGKFFWYYLNNDFE